MQNISDYLFNKACGHFKFIVLFYLIIFSDHIVNKSSL